MHAVSDNCNHRAVGKSRICRSIGHIENVLGKNYPLLRQLFLEVSTAKKIGNAAQSIIL